MKKYLVIVLLVGVCLNQKNASFIFKHFLLNK